MSTALYLAAQQHAVRDLMKGYCRIKAQPVTEEGRSNFRELLDEVTKVIDPARCRAIVVLAVQDPDPAQIPPGEKAEENLQHTMMASGYSMLIETLLAERLAAMRLELTTGDDGLLESLAELGVQVTANQSHPSEAN